MSTRHEEQIRADIVEAGRRMYSRGYVASNDGNISARLDERRLLTTPKSVSKGFMTPDMMVVVDYDGNKVTGDRDASSELPMHLEIYRNRPDVNGVVHAHPPMATGFAVAGIPLTRAVLAEVITTLGSIPIAEYGTPSTAELPEAVRKYIKAHDGMLLANHGAVTCGPSVMAAYYKMETIEHFAKISLVARLLGREHLISREEVERLQGLRGYYGIAAPAPLCTDPDMPQDAGQVLCQVLEAPESATGRLVPDIAPPLPTSARGADRPAGTDARSALEAASRDGEIRLTYGELTALIADAIKQLRD
jgi:L-fuculose-phosphate aldolase